VLGDPVSVSISAGTNREFWNQRGGPRDRLDPIGRFGDRRPVVMSLLPDGPQREEQPSAVRQQ
jgi:hypothetical protein